MPRIINAYEDRLCWPRLEETRVRRIIHGMLDAQTHESRRANDPPTFGRGELATRFALVFATYRVAFLPSSVRRCWRWDSNPQGLRPPSANRLRLPVSPRQHTIPAANRDNPRARRTALAHSPSRTTEGYSPRAQCVSPFLRRIHQLYADLCLRPSEIANRNICPHMCLDMVLR